MSNDLRSLPAVNEILESPGLQAVCQETAQTIVTEAVREELELLRKRLLDGQSVDGEASVDSIAVKASNRVRSRIRPKLRTVLNATGIILHTNLGRAPMAEAAAKAAKEAAQSYLNLELDLTSGKRSSRQDAVRDWICRLTGAESATVVNNNAAATMLALKALATGREVIVSRGQLVEIGGSFRIPDIMATSGAILREVGSTNITRIGDYERAITPETGILLRVHCSNYRIAGHTKTATLEEMVELARKHDLIVVDDIGSGALVDYSRWGFTDEPAARESIDQGADLTLFSGDKLLGGPQAGILAGRRDLIQRIEKDPLMRAFRLDKMTLAALEQTLRIYLNEEKALKEIPILRMLETPLKELRRRAEDLAKELDGSRAFSHIEVREDTTYVGGGSLPDQAIRTIVVAISPQNIGEDEFARRLRTGDPAVLARIQDGQVLLDLRTVPVESTAQVVEAARRAVSH